MGHCDKLVLCQAYVDFREHIVWKKKGTVSEISFMGTAESVSTQNNIMLLALLMEAAKVGAKSKGYNGTFVSSSNELLTVIYLCTIN